MLTFLFELEQSQNHIQVETRASKQARLSK
jgi:hypothetical protein